MEGGGKKKTTQKYLGQGSYGCTLTPGFNCKGKTNKSQYKVNKIQEINYISKNEIEISEFIKKIKHYKKRYVPINKFCIVKFNKIENSHEITENCDNLISKYENYYYTNIINKTNLINKQYYMFYMRYVNGSGLKKYLLSDNFKSYDLFFHEFFYNLYYLLNSIYLLNQYKIVHNDLHYNNILYDLNYKVPLIIDFGLSYKYKFLFKNVNGIDYKYINKHFFHWEELRYWFLMEKKFISFFTYNSSLKFTSYVNSDYAENKLTQEIVDIFIDDAYNSFYIEPEIKILFKEEEFAEFFKVLQNFYYKFIPENDTEKKYLNYSDIIKELLPFVFKFNDLHSITSSFIQIFYYKLQLDNNFNIDSQKYIFIIDFIKSLFKKVYYPDPNYRLSTYQFISIFSFVFKFCQSIDIKQNYLDKKQNYLDKFYNNLYSLLEKLSITYDSFFDKNFSYINFDLLLEIENIKLIQSFNFTIM